MANKFFCTTENCPGRRHNSLIKWGKFRRQDDCRWIQRFRCRDCKKTVSASTFSDTYRQKLRRINHQISFLFSMKMGLRDIGRFLKINIRTVIHRLRFLGRRCKRHFLKLKVRNVSQIQFDELQTSVHTKCKPVSIPVVVCAVTRTILALGVASMPAQPPLAEIAMKKYGPRDDERPKVIREVLLRAKPMLSTSLTIVTDCALHYPEPIAEILPSAKHVKHLSRRARIGGQGELKKIGLDPLFSLNHTAAMMRDGVSRLIRKTWCNSKRQDHLEHHLYIYAYYRNKYRLKHKLPGA